MEFSNPTIQQLGDLTFVQFQTGNGLPENFRPGSDFVEKDLIIEEISEGGSVNHLRATNKSPYFLILTDGDLLRGAKQNRVLNASIILAPGKSYDIDVSCVEAGRWRYDSARFFSSDHYADYEMRSKKARKVSQSLKRKMGFRSDQSEVWDHVSHMSARFHAQSPSSDYLEARHQIGEKLEKMSSKEDGGDPKMKEKPVTYQEGANGVAVFRDGKLVGMDVFGDARFMEHYFPKLTGSVSFLGRRDKKEEVDETKLLEKVEAALSTDTLKKARPVKGMGEGTERRVTEGERTLFELDYEEDLVHMTVMG